MSENVLDTLETILAGGKHPIPDGPSPARMESLPGCADGRVAVPDFSIRADRCMWVHLRGWSCLPGWKFSGRSLCGFAVDVTACPDGFFARMPANCADGQFCPDARMPSNSILPGWIFLPGCADTFARILARILSTSQTKLLRREFLEKIDRKTFESHSKMVLEVFFFTLETVLGSKLFGRVILGSIYVANP